ncbi:MAG: methyltransferase domain-containing protein [Actinomycetota bacterium]
MRAWPQARSRPLAALYDRENGGRDDTEFYVALAAGLDSEHVVDLGCGTGVLALVLAGAGHRVTGVDPARRRCWTSRAPSRAPRP